MSDQEQAPQLESDTGAKWGMFIVGAMILAIVIGAGAYGVVFVRRAMLSELIYNASAHIEGLAKALDAYRGYYPGFVPSRQSELGPEMDFERYQENGGMLLAEPDEFINNLPDPFSPVPEGRLRYWADDDNWKIWSAGPNHKYDLKDPAVYSSIDPNALERITPFQYDSTNGISSAGDFISIHHRVPHEEESLF